MARDALTRNLRDGEMTILDGAGSPVSLTLVLDEGDLEWTQQAVGTETIEIKDRGALSHTRPGDQMSCSLSYSVKWTQLIGDTVTGSSDSAEFYEFVTNRHSTYTSTSGVGEQFTLKHRFLVTAPGGVSQTSERITFAKVYGGDVGPKEGDEYNTISFSGNDFEIRPLIERV